MKNIVVPIYYQVYRRDAVGWFIQDPHRVFYGETTNLQKIARLFDTTEQAVILELFRINGGRSGYYLANLRDRKYYYCGLQWQDVKTKLLEIGIGRDDPHS